MKKPLLLSLLIIGSISLMSLVAQSSLSKRSTKQIVFHCNNATLTQSIEKFYTMGYRVVHITSQSVSTSIDNYGNSATRAEKDIYGEIIVIMEQ